MAIFSLSGQQAIGQPDTLAGDSLLVSAQDTIVTDSILTDTTRKPPPFVDYPVSYAAKDSMVMEMSSKMVFLYRESEVKYADIELTAAEIRFNLGTNIVEAHLARDTVGERYGIPKFVDKDETFEADSLAYNFRSQRGITYGVITQQEGGYLHGKVTKKQTDGSIHVKEGKYTTCALEHPHFHFQLTKAKMIPHEKVITGPCYLVVSDMPTPIVLPFGYFPLHKGSHSGILIPSYGEERNRGFFFRGGGVYLVLSEYADLKLTGNIYSKGSWGVAVESEYLKRYRFGGNLSYEYSVIKQGEEGTTDYSKATSWWIKWSHRQDPKARPGQTFSASVNMGSSDYHSLNTVESGAYLSNSFNSSVSYSTSFFNSLVNMNASLRHSLDVKNKTADLDAPQLTLSMGSKQPFSGLSWGGKRTNFIRKFSVSASASIKNSASEPDSLLFTKDATYRNGLQYNVPLKTSIKVLKHFTLSPRLNYTGRLYPNYVDRTWYDIYETGDTLYYNYQHIDTLSGFKHVFDFNAGVQLNTKVYGTFSRVAWSKKNKGKDFWLKAVRHVITPGVSFSYRPDFSEDKWGYYQEIQSDSLGTMQQYSYTQNGIFGTAPSGRNGSVGFNLSNILEMKVRDDKDSTQATKKIKLIESLSASTSYNLAADSMNWSMIGLNGRTSFFNFLNITASMSFDPYAIDSVTGRRINKTEWEANGRIARPTSFSASTGFSLNNKTLNRNKDGKDEVEEIGYNYRIDYVDFSVPWDVSIDYSFSGQNRYNLNKKKFEWTKTQSVRFSGSLSLTEKWRLSFMSGYDFELGKLNYTTCRLHRDLHCWEMSLSWVPFGARRSYNFQINAKAAIFRDVKYNKRKSFYDN